VLELLNKLRDQCLLKGVGGLKSLSVAFRRMDTDISNCLSYQKLEQGLNLYGVEFDKSDHRLLFDSFDRDRNKKIDFLKLIAKLRPPICQNLESMS
jgi:Ca2+-binding EF-hand superfamily protein